MFCFYELLNFQVKALIKFCSLYSDPLDVTKKDQNFFEKGSKMIETLRKIGSKRVRGQKRGSQRSIQPPNGGGGGEGGGGGRGGVHMLTCTVGHIIGRFYLVPI